MTQRPTAEAERARHHLAGLSDPIAALAAQDATVRRALSFATEEVAAEDRVDRLVRSIVGQQISMVAARAIYGRLTVLAGGRIDADRLVEVADEDLLGAGLSRAKARAIHELAVEVTAGRLDLAALDALSDDDALARLTALRGIGPWSAQMFLLEALHRPDVFPAGDVGLRHAIAALDGLPETPSVAVAEARARAWSPYRSYAALYLWANAAPIAD